VRLEDFAMLILKGNLSVPIETSDGEYLEVDGELLQATIKVHIS